MWFKHKWDVSPSVTSLVYFLAMKFICWKLQNMVVLHPVLFPGATNTAIGYIPVPPDSESSLQVLMYHSKVFSLAWNDQSWCATDEVYKVKELLCKLRPMTQYGNPEKSHLHYLAICLVFPLTHSGMLSFDTNNAIWIFYSKKKKKDYK